MPHMSGLHLIEMVVKTDQTKAKCIYCAKDVTTKERKMV